jgi:hypothetical protein
LIDAGALVNRINSKDEENLVQIEVPASLSIWNVKWNQDKSRMASFGTNNIIWIHKSHDNYEVDRELRGHNNPVRDV